MSRCTASELRGSRSSAATPRPFRRVAAPALLLALLTARTANAEPQPRVALLPLDLKGQLAPRALQVLDQRLALGVSAAAMTVVASSQAKAPMPSSGGCGPACRQGVASQLSARFVAGGRVAVRYDDYVIELWLADGRTGNVLTELQRRCDVCGISAAAETMDLAASELVARHRTDRRTPASVAVATQPLAAELFVDGAARGRAPQTLVLAPGRHRLEARSPGHVPELRTITTTAGEQLTLALRLVPVVAAQDADTELPAPAGLAPWRRGVGWSAVVTGLAAVVGGVALLLVDGDAVDCTTGRALAQVCRGERRSAILGWTLLGSGVAAAATGSLLLTLP